MALFSKEAPIKTVTRDRDNAKANVDRLAARAVEVEKAVNARRSEAQRLAFDNADDATLGKAEAALRGALDRQGTIGAASTEAGKLLALLESQLAELLDKKQRAATSAEVSEMADQLAQANESVVIAMTALAAVTSRTATFIAEARGLEVFATSALVQIPEAVSYISRALREHGAGVLRGEGASSIRPVEVFVPPVEPVQPVLTQVFSLHAIQFVDHHGNLRRVGKWHDVELPEMAAQRALRLGICVPMTDPRCNQRRGQSPGHPEPHWCNNIDTETGPDISLEPQAACRVRSNESSMTGACLWCGSKQGEACPMPLNVEQPASQFTPIDRGGPYKIAIAR